MTMTQLAGSKREVSLRTEEVSDDKYPPVTFALKHKLILGLLQGLNMFRCSASLVF